MPLPIKDATEGIIGIRIANRFKGLPSKGQIRVEENSRSRIIRSSVHVVLELNELINTLYPEFSSNNAIGESSSSEQKKEGHLSSSSDGEGVQREGAC